MSRRALLTVLALATVYVIWGSTYLAIAVAVETMPPFLMAAVRFLIAGGVLFAWTRVRDRGGRGERLTARQLGASALVGTLLLLGGNGLVSWGEQQGVASGLAALLVASTPLWMALLGRVLFRERLSALSLAGVLLGFAGVAVLVQVGGAAGGNPAGAIAILVAAFLWGLGSVWSQHLPLPKDPLTSTGLEMLTGGTVILGVSLVLGEPFAFDMGAVSARSWFGLAYLITAGSLVAYTAYTWLLANVRTDLVGTYAYVNPLVAVLLGWAVLAEPVTVTTLVGGGIVVLSVALVVLARRRAAREPVEAGLSEEPLGQAGAVPASASQGGPT
jgi:drug/metabolite transporter (DMT)-like permease